MYQSIPGSSSCRIWHCIMCEIVRNGAELTGNQWCGPRPSVFGQDRSETKKSVLVLVLHDVVLVLKIWCCSVKHDLVTLVVIMILKDTATFQVLFIVSLFCAWNISTVDNNSGVHLLKKLNPRRAFVYFRWFWSWSWFW